jgi:hypothetical protein
MQQFLQFITWRLFTAQHDSGALPPIIRSSTTAVAASGFTFWAWYKSGVVRGRAGGLAGPTTTVKSEAANAVIELLMMGGKMPETCWAVNKRQDNKLENYCIWLVDLFE